MLPSLSNTRIGYVEDKFGADVVIPSAMLEEFKVMVKRAMSTWQDVSPEMRDFADRVAGVDKYVGQNMKAGHNSNIDRIKQNCSYPYAYDDTDEATSASTNDC